MKSDSDVIGHAEACLFKTAQHLRQTRDNGIGPVFRKPRKKQLIAPPVHDQWRQSVLGAHSILLHQISGQPIVVYPLVMITEIDQTNAAIVSTLQLCEKR